MVAKLETAVTIKFNPPVHSGGLGTLLVGTEELVWTDGTASLSFDYRSIIVHAIARLGDTHSSAPMIYCQMQDMHFEDENGNIVSEEEGIELPNEMRLIPEDPSMLDEIYQAMCECASLHSDFMDEPEMGEDAERMEALFESAMEEHGSKKLKLGQFDDADEIVL
ncbi:regulator of volume decrease after cellular swelling-domain-containing protein, partial [Gorgonomyces haynaldii]